MMMATAITATATQKVIIDPALATIKFNNLVFASVDS